MIFLNMIHADILITNGIVLTNDSEDRQIENGVVAVAGNKITATGTADTFSEYTAGEVIDAQGGIIMPGLVNTHTHMPMSLFRGLADDLPLMEWLNDYIFPAEQKHINPKSVRLGTLLSCAEMILSGTTTCCDGYFYEDEVAAAFRETGMRGVLGQGVIDFPAPGVPDPENNIKNAAAFVEKWKNTSPYLTPSIFCHSPYTCSQETLKRAKAAADKHGLLFQIHAAETKHELDRIQAEHKTTPIQYLDQIGILDDKTLLVHAVWVNQDDITIMADRKVNVSHNPESNMKLASGIAPIPELIKSGITVGLGTDGCASNNDLDLFREMDSAAKLHKAHLLDPTVMNARQVFKMATIEGAKAIGLDKQVGSLEPGKQADIIIIDTHKPHLTPIYNPISHLVYAATGADVRDVIVSGKVLVRDRELLTIDVDALLEKVSRLLP